MDKDDTSTVDAETPPAPAGTDPGQAAPGADAPPTDAPATDEDTAAAQAKAWFDEDDEAPEATDKPAAAEPEAEEPATSAAPADDKTAPAAAKPPATEPAPALPVQQPPDERFRGELQAVVQKAIANIPDKIKVGEAEVDVTPFLKDFSEAPAVIGHLVVDVLQQVVGPYLPMMRAMQEQQAREFFFDQVAAQVPEVRTVAASPEFQAWVAKQPEKFQAMAADPDVASAVFVLKQYAAANPPQRPSRPAARPTVPASPAFEKRKGTLSSTLGGKPASRSGAGIADKNDYKTAFDEDL